MQKKQETGAQSLGQENPLEKEMATDSSILAWEISRTEEPGRLQSIGSQRARHNCSDLAQHCTAQPWLELNKAFHWKQASIFAQIKGWFQSVASRWRCALANILPGDV